jgi:purine-binding chemotaxis protein CheW
MTRHPIPSNGNQTGSLAANSSITILTFKVGEQTYGLPVTEVVKIIEMVSITQLPQAPKAIQGIINVRGDVALVIDLRLRFDLPFQPYGLHTPIILADFKGRMLGLVVDSVAEVLEIASTDLVASVEMIPSELMTDQGQSFQSAYLSGVARVNRQFIPLLKLDTILTLYEEAQLKQVMSNYEFEGAPS